MTQKNWQFWIDRGGTFTDIVAQHPDGDLLTHKLLSDNPQHYQDAAVQGIRDILKLNHNEPLPTHQIATIKMGTTVATNALLERKGERTVLLITKGFGDALRIGYQNRPDLFALNIVLPELLYEQVIEVDERYSAEGAELRAVQLETLRPALQSARQQGIFSVAIVFMHGYRYPQHEQQVAALAEELGFTQISVSHKVSPLIKLVSRGDTTVVDAYLSPILRRYVNNVTNEVGDVKLLFMQSNGGLTDAKLFQGKDAILSGPAGGYVGAVKTAALAGFEKIINFDMGGTSTDVSHYAGEYEREFETQVAGIRMRTPIMRINTVAAGGGSILHFDGMRFRVGPDSAGAKPGPACYRQDGPLTVTDCNVVLGKLHGRYFPQVFGESAQEPLDEDIVKEKFITLAQKINESTGQQRTVTQVAEGFLKIAVDNMANAIKKISVQRGYDITEYTLCCFGAAAGQHACLVAEALGIKTILIHPKAGVLSALGMGLADIRTMHEKSITAELNDSLIPELENVLKNLEKQGRIELHQQDVPDNNIIVQYKVHLRYAGTDTALLIDFAPCADMKIAFATLHQQRFGFIRQDNTLLIVEAVSVEVVGGMEKNNEKMKDESKNCEQKTINRLDTVKMISGEQIYTTPIYYRDDLPVQKIIGPAIVIEKTGTTIIEPGWQAEITHRHDIILTRRTPDAVAPSNSISKAASVHKTADPVMLEIFNNLFMSIAEQMGATLKNTAYSVNIKERLDFSCAVFDQAGQLIANAPHIPIHLGSMSDSVQAVIEEEGDSMQLGDVFVLNNPYHGGTHLPDVTIITPVFGECERECEREKVLFYVASRGHHADIGGITPGSMPAHSRILHQEGVVIDVFKLVDKGQLRETEIRKLLTTSAYPTRNVEQNLADLRAQIAANVTGVQELHKMVQHFGLEVVQAYMQHVQDNAEEAVRKLLDEKGGKEGIFRYELDDGTAIQVRITIDKQQRSAIIDFSGTSKQQKSNFNAPPSVCKAAVLYVFRTLVQDDIPMNAGCLKPLQIIIPKGCLLNPVSPAAIFTGCLKGLILPRNCFLNRFSPPAVVAGNVETSQCVTDTLYGALGVMAASQGTMNNFTFGNDKYQYYETICGGSGAGPNFHGTSAVHTNMTNSRLTDPEILEWRFPVLLESFAIRKNSGGTGRYHGGDGVVRRICFREPMTASILSGHRRVLPYGMAKGQAGQTGKNWIQRVDGTKENLSSTATVEMQEGDVFVIETPGGGGYGI
ncbi:hydantoinase B/oxoprolinase family protein [Candidatus Parabeggiatoa sp. HSG14]|uniref:hydantoinase B/oxoprolinase family protein n=1 Tax=Candidatus Parabeggiatoa sp. HSG14 TaxID=3055593 RepID=UPI0025A86CC0|nr:hydantoinase B/oxoprolinase family protein [Thiotrichales bacterium HSG14]